MNNPEISSGGETNIKMDRPKFVTGRMLGFLDGMEKFSGINMYGAVPYICDQFNISAQSGFMVLSYWYKQKNSDLNESDDSQPAR